MSAENLVSCFAYDITPEGEKGPVSGCAQDGECIGERQLTTDLALTQTNPKSLMTQPVACTLADYCKEHGCTKTEKLYHLAEQFPPTATKET